MKFTIVCFIAILLVQSCVGDYKSQDFGALNALNGWYEPLLGRWSKTNWWTSGNCLNALIDYSLYTNDTSSYTSIIKETFNLNIIYNLQGIDDEGWWGLTSVRGYILTRDSSHLSMAESIFKDMAGYWSNDCGGGIWWDRKRTYKNSVTNELFFSLAAALYLQTRDATYLTWAQKSWSWFESSGLINQQHLVNDGLDSKTCKNNGQTTWTYNQGVVLGGLTNLYTATGNKTLLQVAYNLINGTMSNLVYSDGVLREPCEPQKNCNADAVTFKGIYMRNLGYMYQVTKDPRLAAIIKKNADSIMTKAFSTDLKYHIGAYWEGPFDTADTGRQSSGCEGLNAALLL